ncbi:hypothetical protein CMI37_37000 [Candidatus Pacearchaeota archaeon]|nr:hypothetical protein [Candidatus Pacearchaeota archaeon]
MIRALAKNGTVDKQEQKLDDELTATIFVSDVKMSIETDHGKINKYKSFILVTNTEGQELLMLGYQDQLSPEQIDEQFKILKDDAENIKKADSLHS